MSNPAVKYEGEIDGLDGVKVGDIVYYLGKDGFKHATNAMSIDGEHIYTSSYTFKRSNGYALLRMDMSNATVRATSYYPKAKRNCA